MTLATILTLLSGFTPGFSIDVPEAREFGAFSALPIGSRGTLAIQTGIITSTVDVWIAPVRSDGFVDVKRIQRVLAIGMSGPEADHSFKVAAGLAGTSWMIVATATDARGRFHHSGPQILHIPFPGQYPAPPLPVIAPATGSVQTL